MEKHILIILAVILVMATPFDPSIFLTRFFGWSRYLVIWIIVLCLLLYSVKGHNLKEKWHNIKRIAR